MGQYYDVIRGMKYSWSKFLDGALLKLSFLSMLAGFVGQIPSILNQNGGEFTDLALVAVWMIAYIAVFLFIFFYVTPRLLRRAMALTGVQVGNLPKSLDWLVLHIRLALVDIFCWYDKKLLAPAVILLAIAVLLLIATLVGYGVGAGPMVAVLPIVAMVALVLGIVAWAIASTVHSVRTEFAKYKFLRGDGSERGMPKGSFDVVKGQTLEVFLPQILMGIVIGIAVGIPMFVLVLISTFGGLAWLGTLIVVVIQIPTVAFSSVFMADVFKFFFGASVGTKAVVAAPAKKAPAKKAGKKGKK